ncbi:hypothetical protein [Hymenobacter pini]|nr:hypothetical protein [Hymenobacter pini]
MLLVAGLLGFLVEVLLLEAVDFAVGVARAVITRLFVMLKLAK